VATSPTTRTLGRLRRQGWRAAVVERWNPHARIRQDLWGVLDIVAIRPGETLGIQCTSASNMARRVRKLARSQAVDDLLKAGWAVQVWGWRKDRRGRWTCRIVDLAEVFTVGTG